MSEPTQSSPQPSQPLPEADVFGLLDSCSNWGRWGEDDQRGTLNLITDDKRVQATRLVSSGQVVSLSSDMDPDHADPLGRGSVLERYMLLYSGEESAGGEFEDLGQIFGVREFIGMIPHGSLAHLDSPAHNGFRGHYYNGFPVTGTSTVKGAKNLDVRGSSPGVVSRGVLFDIPALTGRPWLEPGEAVLPEQLEAAEERQGVQLGEGDVFLLHTGAGRRIAAQGVHPQGHTAGLSASCAAWLHERGAAMIGSDALNDVSPSGYDSPDLIVPIHVIGLVAMGLWLCDNLALTELADTCARLGRYEFLFTLAPLRLVGSTSSPINPLAVF